MTGDRKWLTWDGVLKTPVEEYTRRVATGEAFAFSRWGDGEWQSVLGRTHAHNCDGHDYLPAMGRDLRAVLVAKPEYDLGMQPLAVDTWPSEINAFVHQHDLHALKWHDADVFHWAISHEDRHDAFRDFVRAVRGRPVVVVGPPHLRAGLKALLDWTAFVEVPAINCYKAFDHVIAETKGLCDALAARGARPFVSVSYSMPSEILIDRLWRSAWPEHRPQLVDMGSVWDAYCGVNSRSYMRKLAERGFEYPRP